MLFGRSASQLSPLEAAQLASALSSLAGGGVFTVGEIGALLVGCIVAFVVSILAIRFLMDYVKKHTFTAFGWYRIALGIVVLGVWALQTFVLA